MSAIPLADAASLHERALRTLLVRLGLAAALAALLGAAWLAARRLETQSSSYFAGGTSGVVVLDLSTSIDPSRYRRIGRVLGTLVRTSQPAGLVVYSDVAYEAVPTGTRGDVQRSLLRFFEAPPSLPLGQPFRYPDSPWAGSFRGGTTISAGLRVARRMLQRAGARNGTILLVSDLDDSPFDIEALTQEAVNDRRAGIRVRLVPLAPSDANRELFSGLFGRGAFVQNRELLANSALEERRTLVGAFPVWLAVAAAALLLVVAANEWLLAPLAWRRRPA